MFHNPAIRFSLMALLAAGLPRALYSAGQDHRAQDVVALADATSTCSSLEGLLSEVDVSDWDDRTRSARAPQPMIVDEPSTCPIEFIQDDREGQASADWSLLRQGNLLTA